MQKESSKQLRIAYVLIKNHFNKTNSMTKVLFATLLLIASYSNSKAQELGIRFGEVSGGSVAVDAIFVTSEFNRIHADVSFGEGVGIDVLWDFIYRPLSEEAFNWYVGVGLFTNLSSDFQQGAVGEIGLEYQFKSVPLSLSADYRPAFEIIENTSFHLGGFGFNVRYRFSE